MPTLSVFLRHTLPPISTIRSKFFSNSNKLRGTLPSPRQNNLCHGGTHSYRGKGDGIDGPYQNLKDRALSIGDREAFDLGLYPTHGVKTNVSVEPYADFSDDRIHLRVDLEQG